MIDALPPLREVVAGHGLDARRALGQNFLFDLNLTARIARAAGSFAHDPEKLTDFSDKIMRKEPGVTIVEIGPGPGGLTRALLAQGAERVIAVERDARCLPALSQIAAHYPGRLVVVEGDALEIDAGELVRAHGLGGQDGVKTARICANLPYNIATVLLAKWIEAEPWPPAFDRYVLMFQREVALRIVATPKQRADYGRLAVLCGWRTRARILFDVPPEAFTPPPKVTSSVVELVPNPQPLPCDARLLSQVAKAAFGQRRKMLRQSLKALGDASALLAAAGIEETQRAEEVEVAGFVALARELKRADVARSAHGSENSARR